MAIRAKKYDYKLEQRLAVEHEKGDIIISASAGSGKTFVMINRLVKLIVEEKTSIDRILAITFTESAAADMKRKLAEELAKEYKQSKNPALISSIDGVYTAEIYTIHTFCSRLLKRYFYAVSLAPDFKILPEDESSLLLNEAVDKVLRKAYKEKDSKVLNVIKRHLVKRNDKNFRHTLIEMLNFAESHADFEKPLNNTLKKYSEKEYLALVNKGKKNLDEKLKFLLELVEKEKQKIVQLNDLKLLPFADEIIDGIKGCLNLSASQMEGKDFKIPASKYRPNNEAGIIRERLMDLKGEFSDLINAFKKEYPFNNIVKNQLAECFSHAEVLVELLRQVKTAYDELKREENGLDFNDLEHFALKVLEDPEILQTIKNSYDFVCIDEYQDVNDVQENIALKIKTDNLFMVGDVKQSIYGFRGCRSDFFINKYQEMSKEKDKAISLNYNFRSAKNILSFVNEVFDYCMNLNIYGMEYSTSSRLLSGGVYPEDAQGRAVYHNVILDTYEKEVEEPRIYDVLEESKKVYSEKFSAVGAMVTRIINEELLNTYYDIKEKKFKNVTYKDIAILTRSRSGGYVEEIIKELKEHGIPVLSKAKDDVTLYPEIKILISILKLLDCFLQDVPLCMVLKSAVASLTDEELAKIVLFYKEKHGEKPEFFYEAFQYYVINGVGELQEKLVSFKTYFDNLRFLSSFTSAYEVLERVIREKNILSFNYALDSGAEKVKHIRRFLNYLKGSDKEYSVQEALYKLKDSTAGVEFYSSEENAVTLSTIHASKGLEYPVVIVCGLEKKFNTSDNKKDVYKDEEFGFCVKSYDDDKRVSVNDEYRRIVKNKVTKESLKEETRLFYVALTRAKYSLHLINVSKDLKQNDKYVNAKCYADMIPSTIQVDLVNEKSLRGVSITTEPRKLIIASKDQEKTELLKKRFSFVYPYLADTILPLKTSVTGALDYSSDEPYVKTYFDEDFRSDHTDEKRGIIAHKVLELIDFSSSLPFKLQIENLVDNGLIDKEDIKLINVDNILNALKNPIISTLKDMQVFKEKSFISYIPSQSVNGVISDSNVLVQGVIDLLAIKENEAIILDYKYSKKGKEALIKTYKKQLDLYALAVENSLDVKVIKKAILSLVSGEIVFID